MNEPFFPVPAMVANDPAEGYCQSCPQALPGGFCGGRIQPECLRIDGKGMVRVALSVPAEAWFKTMAQLGQVLQESRNAMAILEEFGPVPALTNWQSKVLPSDGRRRFQPNLAEHASLWAVCETSASGVIYGLEVRDVAGGVFARNLLPKEADHEVFREFVVSHQSPPEETRNWFSPNHAASAARCQRLAQRIPALHAQWATGDREVRRLGARFIPKLLMAAAEARQQVRISFYHRALMRTVMFTPEPTEGIKGGKSLPDRFQGNGVSLHLLRPGMTSVWLWKGQCRGCPEDCWSVEVADPSGQVGLAFLAGATTPQTHWRALIKATLP